MKRKFWLFGGVGVGLAIITAVVVSTCCSEYGEGYSEDQRRNWNEMVEATMNTPEGYYNVLTSYSSTPFNARLRERRDSGDAPEWVVGNWNEASSLPLEGRSVLDVKKLAEQGDAEACLELVFRQFDVDVEYTQAFAFPSLWSIWEIEKYLKLAVDKGRPGSDFLLRVFEMRKRGGVQLPCRKIEGYEFFLKHLDEGDFTLGKIYVYFDPLGHEALSRLNDGLQKKSERW